MPTGQQLINGALTDIMILEQGGTPNASDSTSALNELNNQWDGWGIDDGLIYGTLAKSYVWPLNTSTVAIGPAAAAPFNVAPPTRVYEAYFATPNVPRRKLKLIPRELYFDHADLSASSALAPEELYIGWGIDGATGDFNMSAWPMVSVNWTLELEQAIPFFTWDLATNFFVPPGYKDPIQKALAYRLLSQFGSAVQPQVAEVVMRLGMAAEARIREMNRINRLMQPGMERQPGSPPPDAGAK